MKYMNINEIRQYSYLILPKELFTNKLYQELNNDARIIYGFLLDRLQLSVKNKWHDKNGNVYLIFTREQLAAAAGISVRTVSRAMNLLREAELIEEVRQGLSKPNLIYIGKLKYDSSVKPFKSVLNAQKGKGVKKDFEEREYDYDELERKLLGWE